MCVTERESVQFGPCGLGSISRLQEKRPAALAVTIVIHKAVVCCVDHAEVSTMGYLVSHEETEDTESSSY